LKEATSLSTVLHPLETCCLSSLAKVFADEELRDQPVLRGSALANETFSFQIAYRSNQLLKHARAKVVSALGSVVSIRTVGLVVCEMPIYANHDDNVLRTTPGLYPDPLFPVTDNEGISLVPGQWRSLWVTVSLDGSVKPGTYPITIQFESNEGQALGENTFELTVIGASLPAQQLIHTEWFHTDCLSTYYGVEVFSERHWELISSFIKTAVAHGINMILTPLFTPPLDTKIGGERPTVQLIDVRVDGPGKYSFGFDRLKRWVDMCNELGVEYFEFSHLFTQWGAKHAPKIVAQTASGTTEKIFGWETDATGDDYKSFLAQFLPQLVSFIQEHGLEQRSYFHVSDEPSTQHLESYESASNWLRQFIGEFPMMDALSAYDFYERGLVKRPIPANNHIEPFLENEVEDLWTYYCCSQYQEVSNRFICMPSTRNRILGLQLYKFNIAGFLHWGYNFYYSQYSRYPIDPYRVTDAGHAFPAGDPFVVYPGPDGPIESLRLEVFFEALQDLRALQKLEALIGRERVLGLLEEGLDKPITFNVYPQDPQWLLAKRDQINKLIAEQPL
jgi:hypothetical protein